MWWGQMLWVPRVRNRQVMAISSEVSLSGMSVGQGVPGIQSLKAWHLRLGPKG